MLAVSRTLSTPRSPIEPDFRLDFMVRLCQISRMNGSNRTVQEGAGPAIDGGAAAPEPVEPEAPHPARRLFELVYADLKRMAHSRLNRNGGRAELDTTSLVHESFLRLVEGGEARIVDR